LAAWTAVKSSRRHGRSAGLGGEQTGLFHVLLDGEIRITRTYDRQSILMGVTKPGGYLAKPCCCWIFLGRFGPRFKTGPVVPAR